uniref:TNFR-Cys domain-containing protein n=1 Tax=Chromera velia CCMP2878 TaxID=1169474 RepID=A0A0G4HLY7_9ALVE|eukprot:Cvel_29112.t1-p1 / transcript=Cvel_29112.t1 / gene=Cvel_29112 / organism=Chromera_velia_CCMP2878 / gene_product=hypothetical protein / transcript_product=hypothetical protein / location=Cvel_scaffold3929:6016-12302(-) / protein_length=1359 / sequence_SO=supercontig / SO=protein_coding / is_pseudo=false
MKPVYVKCGSLAPELAYTLRQALFSLGDVETLYRPWEETFVSHGVTSVPALLQMFSEGQQVPMGMHVAVFRALLSALGGKIGGEEVRAFEQRDLLLRSTSSRSGGPSRSDNGGDSQGACGSRDAPSPPPHTPPRHQTAPQHEPPLPLPLPVTRIPCESLDDASPSGGRVGFLGSSAERMCFGSPQSLLNGLVNSSGGVKRGEEEDRGSCHSIQLPLSPQAFECLGSPGGLCGPGGELCRERGEGDEENEEEGGGYDHERVFFRLLGCSPRENGEEIRFDREASGGASPSHSSCSFPRTFLETEETETHLEPSGTDSGCFFGPLSPGGVRDIGPEEGGGTEGQGGGMEEKQYSETSSPSSGGRLGGSAGVDIGNGDCEGLENRPAPSLDRKRETEATVPTDAPPDPPSRSADGVTQNECHEGSSAPSVCGVTPFPSLNAYTNPLFSQMKLPHPWPLRVPLPPSIRGTATASSAQLKAHVGGRLSSGPCGREREFSSVFPSGREKATPKQIAVSRKSGGGAHRNTPGGKKKTESAQTGRCSACGDVSSLSLQKGQTEQGDSGEGNASPAPPTQIRARCPHGKMARFCNLCRPTWFCKHGRNENLCAECGGRSICIHQKRKTHCRQCVPHKFCIHGRWHSLCGPCGGGGAVRIQTTGGGAPMQPNYSVISVSPAVSVSAPAPPSRETRCPQEKVHVRAAVSVSHKPSVPVSVSVALPPLCIVSGEARHPDDKIDGGSSQRKRKAAPAVAAAAVVEQSVANHGPKYQRLLSGNTVSNSVEKHQTFPQNHSAPPPSARKPADNSAPSSLLQSDGGRLSLAASLSLPVSADSHGAHFCEQGRRACPPRGGKQKAPLPPRPFCMHQRQRSKCKECGGSQVCAHGRIRSECKQCKGKSICEHGKRRTRCRDCGGGSFCEHAKRRDHCRICRPENFCQHGKRIESTMRACRDCAESSEFICSHKRRKTRCIDCTPENFCFHRKLRSRCRECVQKRKNSTVVVEVVTSDGEEEIEEENRVQLPRIPPTEAAADSALKKACPKPNGTLHVVTSLEDKEDVKMDSKKTGEAPSPLSPLHPLSTATPGSPHEHSTPFPSPPSFYSYPSPCLDREHSPATDLDTGDETGRGCIPPLDDQKAPEDDAHKDPQDLSPLPLPLPMPEETLVAHTVFISPLSIVPSPSPATDSLHHLLADSPRPPLLADSGKDRGGSHDEGRGLSHLTAGCTFNLSEGPSNSDSPAAGTIMEGRKTRAVRTCRVEGKSGWKRPLCPHGRQRNKCKACVSVCAHQRLPGLCRDCGGGAFCSHGIRRTRCRECGGGSYCQHEVRRDRCRHCTPANFCVHGRLRIECGSCATASSFHYDSNNGSPLSATR